MTNNFALADYLVSVDITDRNVNFNTSYITRVLFLVLDDSLTTDYLYQKNVTAPAEITNAKANYVKDYFYNKSDVKSCDLLYVKAATAIDSALSEEDKQSILNSTYSIVIDYNMKDSIATLDLAFFAGIKMIASSEIVDANLSNKTTYFYFKNAIDVDAINKELATTVSFIFNRSNFYLPVSPKPVDFNSNFPLENITEMESASTNNMCFFAYQNGIAYIIGFSTSDQRDLFAYYDETIRRSVQEGCFNFLVSANTFYTQANLNKITTIAYKELIQYSKEPYNFVDQSSSSVDNINLSNVPQSDIDAEIVRVSMTVKYFNAISKIKINITKNNSEVA